MDYEMVEHNTTLREKKFILFSVKKKKEIHCQYCQKINSISII